MAKVPFLKTEIMDCAAVLITIPLGGTHGNIPYKYTTVQVYDYKKKPPWETMCCIASMKLCVASPLGNSVLHHPWETMCCITPGKLCVASPLGNYVLHQPWETMCCQLWSPAFGSPVLVPSFGPLLWAPVLGRQGPWPSGPMALTSPPGCWHHPWEISSFRYLNLYIYIYINIYIYIYIYIY